jgi:hypothetical protein
VGVSQQIAIFDPMNTSAQTFSESLRLPENNLGAVAGRLVLNWLAAESTLRAMLHTTIGLLFWPVAKLYTVRILTMIHARVQRTNRSSSHVKIEHAVRSTRPISQG